MTKTIKFSSKGKNNKKESRLDLARKGKKSLASRSLKGHSKKKTYARKIAKVFLIITVFVLMTMLAGSVYAFSWLQDLNENLPDPEEPFKDPPIASIIYDRKGEVELYKVIGDVNSDEVNIDEIPEFVKWSFLAAEDSDFYNHNGFDTAGIIRCGVKIIQSGGGNVCGGSTVTQQLIKITALRDETSRIERKIKELFMSTKVEQQSSKDEILEMYLSVTPFGTNVVGVETAARYYFNKDAKDLTLAQSSVIAAIIQNPSYLSPTKPIDGDIETSQARVKVRQLYILEQMERNLDKINNQIKENAKAKADKNDEEYNEEEVELITVELINEAKEEELSYEEPLATNKLAGHFVDFVLGELQEANYKNGEEPFDITDLYNGGYRITTTLDYDLQKVAEQWVKEGASNNINGGYNSFNTALMTMLPTNGQIITMAGSKSFKGESEGCDANGINCKYNPEVNVLTSLQSPGSTNKPMAYYEAINQGKIAEKSLIPDIPIKIGSYEPKNWNSQYDGLQDVREDLRRSRNIPALIILESIGGSDRYRQLARDFGYTTYTDDQDIGPSVVLGGTSVYPIEHAAAYTVFANQGEYVRPEAILKIEDREGNVIFQAEPEKKKVADPASTFIVNQMLRGLTEVPENPSIWNGQISTKTGTTEENKDSWIMTYSPDMVTVGWSGNNNNEPTDLFRGYPIYIVSPWMKGYLSQIKDAEYFKGTPFARPGDVGQGGGNCKAGDDKCFGLTPGWFKSSKVPPSYKKPVEVEVCKDQPDRLARSVDKQLGFAVKKTLYEYKLPAASLQSFLDTYINKDKAKYNAVPTDECDKERTGYNLTVSSTTTAINIKGSIYSPGGAGTVQFYIDNTLLNGCVADNYSNFDITCNYSDSGVTFNQPYYGTYQFSASASGIAGQPFTKRIQIGDGTSNGFSANSPAGNTLQWGVEVGNGISNNILLSFSGGGIGTMKLLASKNGGGFVETGTVNGSNGVVQWGGGIPNENATYTFRIEATAGATGILNSGDILTITVNKQ